ncbi:MarR family winged helix-turn-helix transcriptional regulator [Nakamurella leprariae]|uniref:MarR family transcriptional regulator n=1 Tax=Nakamurella leprariae TaxID=2803911 RepID=A0A938YA31_9ACTN|nr:MarR family transcriptional regulator [Nakamurella leprariae]MBM9468736.1 MarR family transcriptional regulator [Nakamurella leprariae]
MSTPAPPQWLSDEESQAWLALVGVLITLSSTLDTQLQREAGISHFEYQVLAWLSMSQDRTCRMSQLAALTHGSPSRLSHVARRLERRGWMVRRPDPTDGRSTLATLTQAGWHKVQATAPGHVATVRRAVFDPLSPEQVHQLREIGTHIQQAVDPDGWPGLRTG